MRFLLTGTTVAEMHIHPEIRGAMVHQKQREIAAAAERNRMLAPARRRNRDARQKRVGSTRGFHAGREITMRPASPADARALTNLASLDQTRPLTGELLLAEVEGELWAACSVTNGRTIGDPFRPTQAARALLELRRDQIAAAKRCGDDSEPRKLRWLRQLRLGN